MVHSEYEINPVQTSSLKRATPVVNFEISFFVYYTNCEKNFRRHSKSFASCPKNHNASSDMIFHSLQFGVLGPFFNSYNPGIWQVHGSLASMFLGPRNDQVSLAFRVEPICYLSLSLFEILSPLSEKPSYHFCFWWSEFYSKFCLISFKGLSIHRYGIIYLEMGHE